MTHKEFKQANAPRGSSKDFSGVVLFVGSPVAFCKREVVADKSRVIGARVGVVAQSLGNCKSYVTHALGF